MKHLLHCASIVCTIFFISSCNQTSEIPFPGSFSEFPQPEVKPLELTNPKPLQWDTVSRQPIVPKAFPLDFSKLPGKPYDEKGFKPLPAPTESFFDFSSLPSKPFDLSKLPSHELKLQMQSLEASMPSVKVTLPERVASSSLDLSVFQQITGSVNAGPGFFLKDASGFLWMGSTFGLYRFDGSHLETVIPDMAVAGINSDKQGRIWFINQGITAEAKPELIMLDLKNRKYGKINLPYTFATTAPLFRDSEGSFWLGTSDRTPPIAVIKINPENMTYQVLDSTSGLKHQRYFQMTEDAEKNLWLCSANGIDIIMHGQNRLAQLGKSNGLIDDGITSFAQDAEGRIFAAWAQGVDVIDVKDKKISHFQTASSPGRTFKLAFDKIGQLWQGRNTDVNIINFKNHSYRVLNEENGLQPGIGIVDIYDDGQGRVYLSGLHNNLSGLTYIIYQYGNTVYPFGNKTIYSTVEDAREHLWIGTPQQLIVVDSARKTYWSMNASSGMANDTMEATIPYGGKMIVTTNGGYNIYDPIKNELLRVSKSEGLIPEVIYWVMPDAAGCQWISATTEGLFKYDPATHLTLHVSASGGLNGDYMIQTTQLKNGNIWSLTNATPAIINPKKNTIASIKNIPILSQISEKIIFVDSHDRVWLGIIRQLQPGKLFMIDSKNQTFTEFSTKNGLSDNHILSVFEKDGKIIVSTRRMINIITPPELSEDSKWQIKTLRGSENLAKKENTYASDAITKRGNFLWGDDGIHIIYGITTDTTKAQAFVTGIDIMAQPINFEMTKDTGQRPGELRRLRWDSLAGPYAMPVNLRLPYNDNVLQFHFTEMSTGRSDSTTYAYVLEGLDRQWTLTTDDHTQSYLNLEPGKYTLKVRSRWTNGNWSEPATMQFTLLPPWYKTWWAWLIYAIVAVSLLRVYIIFRSRKLQRENKLLEEKVTRRTEELQKSYENVEQLGRIGRKITSSLAVEKIIGTVYKNVNALMDASIFGIGIYNPRNETLEFPATYENGEPLAPYANALAETNRLSVACFYSGKDIIMSNVEEQYKNHIEEYLTPSAGEHAKSLVYLPLTINDKKLGVITVQSFKANAYSENHLNMLHNIANYALIALENAESYSKLNQSLESLKEAQKQLVQSEKMASLGELTAGIAHEIQNPLNFVNNFSELNEELIAEMVEDIAKGKYDEVKLLANDILTNEKKINHHGKRADGIVKAMLQHSRRSTGQKEPIDINALCDEYLRLSYHGLRAKDKSFNSSFTLKPDEHIGKVTVIAQDLGRVLLNLFNNAFYAVREKKMGNTNHYNPEVDVSTKRTENSVIITVSDNGLGIPASLIEKVFQPFFTTKPAGEGTGLGLSLSYDIIKAHGGTIKVKSEEGHGTEFSIRLPLEEGALQQS